MKGSGGGCLADNFSAITHPPPSQLPLPLGTLGSSAREVAAAGSWVARREAQAGPVLLCPLGVGCTLRVRPVVGPDSPDEASLREMVSDLQALAVLGAATAQVTNWPGGGDAHRPWPAHAQGCLHAATLLLALTRASGLTGAVM